MPFRNAENRRGAPLTPARERGPAQSLPMSKHVHITHCWVFKKGEDNELRFTNITSAENATDLFTKAFFKPAFETLRAILD